MSEPATIYEVSPVYYDEDAPDGGPKFADRSGYRYICPDCGWKSPVMRWPLGAIRHLNEHREIHDAPENFC